MKKLTQAIILSVVLLAACSRDNDQTDTEYPVIDLSVADAFPVQCSTVQRGETFTFRARFSDNVALGSYSLDIHENFDHHSHSTEVITCELDPKKDPVNPFTLIRTFDIPNSPQTLDAVAEIQVPEDVDTGDYHFTIKVTDRAGYTALKSVSIKIR